MTTHSSATVNEETPHETERITNTVSDALKRRAQSVISDSSIDRGWRMIIRYALEINDPWLPDLIRRAEAGETIIDTIDFSGTPETNEDELLAGQCAVTLRPWGGHGGPPLQTSIYDN